MIHDDWKMSPPLTYDEDDNEVIKCPDCNDTGWEGETRAKSEDYEDFKPKGACMCPNHQCEARDYRIWQEMKHAEDMRDAMADNPYEERHGK